MEASEMRKVVHAYMDGLTQGDVDAVVALYAEGATVEDPVGSELKVGTDAIREFYAAAVTAGLEAKLSGNIRCTESSAAFAFHLAVGDAPMKIEVIDVFNFNAEGKVVEMRAYWGAENVS
jgi:steroid delta-isomerase